MSLPRPYFEDDAVAIYHADCRDILPHLEPVDLVLTDPPYGIAFKGRGWINEFDVMAGDDGSLELKSILKLTLRLLRRKRHIYIFGDADLSGLPICSPVELIWDKDANGLGDLSLPWSKSHERIWFAVYDSSPANLQREAGRLSARIRQGSVLRIPRIRGSGVQQHPTEKPIALLRQLIESSSLLGEVVLDPFMGSGSTLCAAIEEGRKAIGIEIEERYCEIAAKRLAQGALL